MQEPSEQSGIDFNGTYLVESATLALLCAPIVPHWLAGWFLTGVFLFSGICVVTFFFLDRHFQAMKENGDTSANTLIYTATGLYFEFKLVTSTVFLLAVLLAWIGYAGLLWTFDSFFAMFIALHCLFVTCYPLTRIYSMKVELDETNKVVSVGETPDDTSP